MARIEHFKAGDDPRLIHHIIERDGCVIIDEVADAMLFAQPSIPLPPIIAASLNNQFVEVAAVSHPGRTEAGASFARETAATGGDGHVETLICVLALDHHRDEDAAWRLIPGSHRLQDTVALRHPAASATMWKGSILLHFGAVMRQEGCSPVLKRTGFYVRPLYFAGAALSPQVGTDDGPGKRTRRTFVRHPNTN